MLSQDLLKRLVYKHSLKTPKTTQDTWRDLYSRYEALTGAKLVKNKKLSKIRQIYKAKKQFELWQCYLDLTSTFKNKNKNMSTVEHVRIDNLRYHKVDGILYPGVTTVLSHTDDSYFKKVLIPNLEKERAKLPEKIAKRKKEMPTKVGNYTHQSIEIHLTDRTIPLKGLPKFAQPLLDKIKRVIAVELQLIDTDLAYAGSADLIVELLDGRVALIDWKTSNMNRTPSNSKDYFLQSVAYVKAFEKMYTAGLFPDVKLPNDRVDCVILGVIFKKPQLKKKIRFKELEIGRDEFDPRFNAFCDRLNRFHEMTAPTW